MSKTKKKTDPGVAELRKLAQKAAARAYSPYSKAKVGCALQTSSGKIFVGQNIENSSFGATVCAERVAIFNALTAGESTLEKIYIFTDAGWPPCGICRQVMTEFASKKLIVIIGDKDGAEKTLTLEQIFPLAFTPSHLK